MPEKHPFDPTPEDSVKSRKLDDRDSERELGAKCIQRAFRRIFRPNQTMVLVCHFLESETGVTVERVQGIRFV